MDRGAWRATDHGVAKSWTRLSDSHLLRTHNLIVGTDKYSHMLPICILFKKHLFIWLHRSQLLHAESSSLTRDQTQAPSVGSMEFLATGLPGKPPICITFNKCRCPMLSNCYNCSLLKVLLTPCGKYGSSTREKAVSKNCPEESLINLT